MASEQRNIWWKLEGVTHRVGEGEDEEGEHENKDEGDESEAAESVFDEAWSVSGPRGRVRLQRQPLSILHYRQQYDDAAAIPTQ